MRKEGFEDGAHEAQQGEKTSEKFKTPQEELDFLRAEIAKKEAELSENAPEKEKEEHDVQKVKEYQEKDSSEVIDESAQMPESKKEIYTLDLAPEEHDEKVFELLGVMEEKGIHNALSVVQKMGDPHLEDDLHRVLVQWIKAGYPINGLKEKTALWRSFKMTLFEIALPEQNEEETEKPFDKFISSMEQFYAGMCSESDKDNKDSNNFSFEIAVSESSEEIVLYIAVPDKKRGIFEKNLLAVLPDARIKEQKNDYNIFKDGGEFSASRASLKKSPALPLKTYENFDHDPLNIILNSFSKIAKTGEGTALQFVFNPNADDLTSKYKEAERRLKKGESTKEALDIPLDAKGSIIKSSKEIFREFTSTKKDGEEKKEEAPDQSVMEAVQEKISSKPIKANLRVVTSAENTERAESLLSEIESTFNQFENPNGNKLKFEKAEGKKHKIVEDFVYRKFNENRTLALNIKEATTLAHIPLVNRTTSSEFKRKGMRSASAPQNMSESGLLLGVNEYRGETEDIYLADEDRLRHFYTIGQTGTGKTTLLKNMINQDIKMGNGVCMIDPHGADIEDVLSNIPESRFEDVIYFDPAYTKRVMGLNMLEFDPERPEQKTFVINEVLSIFQKLYADSPEGLGPIFQQYFRNAAALILEDPQSGSTLLDISRVLADEEFRHYKLSKSQNMVVNQFWREVAEKAGGESSLANIVPYITSKTDVFAANDIMRPIIGQQESSLNFREIMDEKKIFLVNLSKGRLGDINSHLLGLIIVGKFLMAALSRSGGSDYAPFYLYIDEFQNVTTDSISAILSEARKYKLSLNIAHQFIAQLDEKIRDSVFGNVGSMASFRVGSDDADFLESQFSPQFEAKDLMNIPNRQAIAKIIVNGEPSKAFDMKTIAPEKGNPAQVEDLKHLSYIKHERDRELVESEIRSRANFDG